jgi:hypothetical protein
MGEYLDARHAFFHGFVRAADGAITTFDAPGAGTGAMQGTMGGSINPAGTIPGTYIDANSANHGYVRAADGAITTFDAPGAGTGSGQGTVPFTNNQSGAIVGYYLDANNVNHGFLRFP